MKKDDAILLIAANIVATKATDGKEVVQKAVAKATKIYSAVEAEQERLHNADKKPTPNSSTFGAAKSKMRRGRR
jgi:hypothetical protein